MASDEELLGIAARAFVESHDFNGMTASSLARETGTGWDELRPQLARLTASGRLNLAFASHATNPHIKRLPDLPVEEQLHRLETEPPSGIGLYPGEEALRPLVDTPSLADSPYTMRLALGAPQLVPVFFELKVLATYFNDPRYCCKFWDSSGTISVSDEHYQSEAMPEKDKALLQSFGIGYDGARNRVVVVFLRYLSDLSPQHQRIWQAHEMAGPCTMNSDYARASLYGEWPEFRSVYEAFIEEQVEINKLAALIGKPPLFKRTWDGDDRPLEFAPMLLPTRRQLQAFAHTLDKLLSENVDKAFFKGDIELEDRIEAADGSVERRPLGSITLLERWLRKRYRTANGDEVSAEVVGPWREVRKARQAPAHALTQDAYDLSFPSAQDEMLGNVVQSLRKLRLVLWSHPKARDAYKPPEWLDGDKIVFY